MTETNVHRTPKVPYRTDNFDENHCRFRTGTVRIGAEDTNRIALVVFTDTTEVAWLRILKPGFRHCFVVLGGHSGWVFMNPLLHRTELEWIDGYDQTDVTALAVFYRRLGLRVVMTVPRIPPRRVGLPVPHSCVEAVKRVLGICAFHVLTPWQLYKYLKKLNIKENIP